MKWVLFVLVMNTSNPDYWGETWYEDEKMFDTEGECVSHFMSLKDLSKPEKGDLVGFCTQGRLIMARPEQFKKSEPEK